MKEYNANGGYSGYSMSNRAVSAYNDGEMPLSKWTKALILASVEELLTSGADEIMSKLRQLSKRTLASHFLVYASWHHTSSYYNKTEFYRIDDYAVEHLTLETCNELKQKDLASKQEQTEEKQPNPCYVGTLNYLEWSGTRRHPRATAKSELGIVEERGRFYVLYRQDGAEMLRKKMSANGVSVVRQPGLEKTPEWKAALKTVQKNIK